VPRFRDRAEVAPDGRPARRGRWILEVLEEGTMTFELRADEAELLRTLMLAELEVKRVELHHAKNIDYKAELEKQRKLIQDILKRLQ
jgi:hypothetical protein